MKYNSKTQYLEIENGRLTAEIFHRAFWYDDEIWKNESPRIDIFFEKSDRYVKRVREFFHLKDERVVFYAQTYRDYFKTDNMQLDFERKFSIGFTIIFIE